MAQLFDLHFETKEDKPKAQKLISGQGFQTLSISFAPGQVVPAHKHPNMNVLVLVIKGEVALVSELERSSVAEGQIALFSGDMAHSLENAHATQTNVVVTVIPKAA